MKLRLRSLQSNQTLKLEVPETCSLHDLAQILSESLPSPPPSTSPPRFSLNRKEELLGSSPVEPLRSLGITSGDLIYFSCDPNHFSPVLLDGTLGSASISSSAVSIRGPAPAQEGTSSEIDGDSGLLGVDENMKGESSNVNSAVDEQRDFVDGEKPDGFDCMDIDAVPSEDVVVSSKRFSEPYFLRRILREELVDCDSHHKLLVAAIHAVFLESGFVGYDSLSGSRIDQLHMSVDWPLKQSTLSVLYTLPELLGKDVSVAMKFQTLGNFLNAFSSLNAGGSKMHRLCLNGNTYAPTLRQIWQLNCHNNNNNNDMVAEDDESIIGMSSCENEVFKFWKDVKDGLCLPLLIDLCEKAGLPMPSCFSSLPTDLKLSILTLLPGVDIARMECVSMETRYLSSNNELWKQKFAEEFGSVQLRASTVVVNWKQKFATEVVSKKKRKREEMFRVGAGRMMRLVPRNNLGRYPLIWGGDHDLIPGLGIPSPFPNVGPGIGAPHLFTQDGGPSFLQRGRRMPRDVRTDSDLRLFGHHQQW
ncbi:F-box protein SKIP22 [Linum grandiflorum]